MDKSAQLPTISLNYLQFAFTPHRPISTPPNLGFVWLAIGTDDCIKAQKICEHCHTATASPYTCVCKTQPHNSDNLRESTTQALRLYVITGITPQHRYNILLPLTRYAAHSIGLVVEIFQAARRPRVSKNGPLELQTVEAQTSVHWLPLHRVKDKVLPCQGQFLHPGKLTTLKYGDCPLVPQACNQNTNRQWNIRVWVRACSPT